MRYIDLHCDTLHRILFEGGDIQSNDYQIDIKKLLKGECLLQAFAVYFDEAKAAARGEDGYALYCRFVDCYHRQLSLAEGILLDFQKQDLQEAQANQAYALLSVESCGFAEGDFARLEQMARDGVRIASLTWNYENCMGYPNAPEDADMQRGLKPFGKAAVECFNALKIIPDISHLSFGGAEDVLKISRRPVIASHSNAYGITPHPRNLPDSLIRAVADSGGVIGANFYPIFLTGENTSTVADIVWHIEYLRRIGGEDCVAIGSDFDGMEIPSAIADASQMPLLYQALKDARLPESLIEKIFYKNALRVINEYF